MDFKEYQRQRDDGYRAIGRYVVAFSQLMHQMRELVRMRIAPASRDAENATYVDMILGEAQPKLIVDSFFGMCRLRADFTKPEQEIEKHLRNKVVQISLMRNDIAHGDWWVGQLYDPVSPTVEDPTLVRIKPGRVEGHPEQAIELSTTDLDKMADDLADLTDTVIEFGRLALGLAVLRTMSNGEHEVSLGDLRVADVYRLEGSKKSPPIRVERTGPKVDVVPLVHWVGKRTVIPERSLIAMLDPD